MIQNKKRIISLILMLTLLVSSLVVGAITASAASGDTYEKATSIAAGDTVLLVCESKNMELSSIDSYGVGTAYNNDAPVGAYALTVEVGYSNDTYSFKNGDNYLSWSSSNSLKTSTTKDANSSWKVTFSGSDVTIVNAKDNARKLQWNASSPRFACYTSAQTAVQLYKLANGGTTACEHTETVALPEVPANCTTPGKTSGVKCANPDCGEIITAQETIPATGHTYENHKCACGASEPLATFFVNGVEYSTVYGETVTLPACDVDVSSFNKYTYTFAGWVVEEITEGVAETTFNKAGENVKLTTDKSFYAVFTYGQAGGEVVSYKKVTSAPSDWSGTYLIVYEDGNVAFNGGLTTLDAVGNTIGVTITNNEIKANSTTNIATFTIEKSGENYTIKSASGKYIGQTSNANGLASGTSTTYANTLSINADGTVNFVSGGAYLRYNATIGQVRFRYYKSSSYTVQKAINLYAKTIETGTVDYYTTKLEQTEHKHDYKEVVTNPTCTEGGYTTYTCACGDAYTGNETSALGHDFGEGLIAEVPATCISTGIMAHNYCSVCEKYFDEDENEILDTTIAIDPFAHDETYADNAVCGCGACYTYVFDSKQFDSNKMTLDLGGIKWNITGDGGYFGYSPEKGHQFGSSKAPFTNLTLTLTGFKNVTKIIVNTSGANEIAGSFVVTVNGNQIGEITTLSSTATDREFELAPTSGAIVLTYTQTSSVALYIESIRVYGDGICDHDYADATCTAPKTCRTCGATEGEALGHTYMDGVCDCGNTIDVLEKNSEGVIVLSGNLDAKGVIVFTENSVINLNGKTLTANGVITFHETTRFVGEGKLVIPQNGLVLSGESSSLPVWHEANGDVPGHYTFNTVVKQSIDKNVTHDGFKVLFRPSLGDTDVNEELFTNGVNDYEFLLYVYEVTEGTYTLVTDSNGLAVDEDLIQDAYKNGKAIGITITGAKAETTYAVKLVVKSNGLTNTAEIAKVTTLEAPEVEGTPAE